MDKDRAVGRFSALVLAFGFLIISAHAAEPGALLTGSAAMAIGRVMRLESEAKSQWRIWPRLAQTNSPTK
jgi:hypothetical protein